MDAERSSLDRSNDAEFRRQLTETLRLQIIKYAAVILGNRVGSHPDTCPDDLAHRAIADPLDGTRNWNPEKTSAKNYLRGCVKSYISHHFDSLAHKRRADMRQPDPRTTSHENGYSNGASIQNGAGSLPVDHTTPEELAIVQQTLEAIDRLVLEQGVPELIRMWELVWKEHLNLKDDRLELCEALGLDPAVEGPDYQKFNRLRNDLKELAKSVVADVPLSRREQALLEWRTRDSFIDLQTTGLHDGI